MRAAAAVDASLAPAAVEWLEAGWSTEAADRERAARAVARAYAAVNLPPPETILWMSSPYAGILAAHLLKVHLGDAAVTPRFWRLRDRLARRARRRRTGMRWGDIARVFQPVEAQVWQGVGAVLDRALRVVDNPSDEWLRQVWDGMRAQAGRALFDADPRRVWDEGWSPAALLRSGSTRPAFVPPCYGNHDAGWLGPLDAATRFAGDECLAGLVELARSSGWWWPMRRAVVLSDRPARLERNEEGLLHCEDGAAAVYRDGWSLHAWHGVGVARWVIDQPDLVTPGMIGNQSDVSMKRVLLERYGYARYVQELGCEVQSDDWGSLWRASTFDDEPLVMVHVLNATPEPDGSFKDYFLRVPPGVTSARQAVAWTFAATEDGYGPKVQT